MDIDEQQKQERILAFATSHPLMILSTVHDNRPWGAAVMVYAEPTEQGVSCYILMREHTRKFENLMKNPHVAITVADAKEVKTLQISGKARNVKENDTYTRISGVLATIGHTQVDAILPVNALQTGKTCIIEIVCDHLRLGSYEDVPRMEELVYKTSHR